MCLFFPALLARIDVSLARSGGQASLRSTAGTAKKKARDNAVSPTLGSISMDRKNGRSNAWIHATVSVATSRSVLK
jgi:hypothetical protein